MSLLADFLFKADLDAHPGAMVRRALRYFNIYRLVIATIFFVAALTVDQVSMFETTDPRIFVRLCAIYALLATVLLFWPSRYRLSFNAHLTVGVLVDVAILTLMMHYTGGARSPFAYIILIALAGAGLVGEGRLVLFHAAMATLALLMEQTAQVLSGGDTTDFLYAGLMSTGFFGSAVSARLLARRVVANEALASRRGQELEAQLHLNQRVIRDMQDGVLVADKFGNVRQFNPRASALFSCNVTDPTAVLHLVDFSTVLAERFKVWCNAAEEVTEMIRLSSNQRLLRVRFLPPGDRGNALLYVEDMDRLQTQSQQIKLAALGRLTANMAHEIRNPLAAISHAAELMGEEPQDATQGRLTSIITDNAQRLNRIVAEVLELGRRDRAAVEAINLRDFLLTLVEELSLNQPRLNSVISVAVAPSLNVNFDRGHLYRIVTNLLVNALRYCSDDPAAIQVSAVLNEEGMVELHLLDDGPGISDSLRAQIFEPFFTTHSGGTGLGLYIARELCEANGAELKLLENAPGAHFCILARTN